MKHEERISAALTGLHDAMVIKSGHIEGRIENIERISGVGISSTSLGESILKSGALDGFKEQKHANAVIEVSQHQIKTAIIGSTGIDDPLTNSMRPGIATGPRRRLFIRDLLSVDPTTDGIIKYPIEDSFTNTAASQNGQNTALTESGFTFSLSSEICQTIGHYIHTSKQVLDDSAVLTNFLSNRLLYGLRLVEENQLLNGTGASGQLNGILGQATAYTVQSPQLSNEIDIIADAMLQGETTDYMPNAIVLNPTDWHSIKTRKAGASNDAYAGGDPVSVKDNTLWGLPVVSTNSIAAGTFLVGDFTKGAAIFDREQPSIEFSKMHNTNFRDGMVTILASERTVLVVTNPAALITGSL